MPFKYIFPNSFLSESKCGLHLSSVLGKSHSLPGRKRCGTEAGILLSAHQGAVNWLNKLVYVEQSKKVVDEILPLDMCIRNVRGLLYFTGFLAT